VYRGVFIGVASLAILVLAIGGIVDGNFARIAHSSDECYSFNNMYNHTFCCDLKSPSYNGDILANACDANSKTFKGSKTCLCCKGPDHHEWKVRFGDCSDIPLKYAGVLGASAAFNILSAFALAFSLSFTCCKCLGGGEGSGFKGSRTRANI